MTVKVYLSKEEQRLAEAYAKTKGVSISEALKNAFLEKAEEANDIALADKGLAEFEKNPKTYSHEEVKKEFGF